MHGRVVRCGARRSEYGDRFELRHIGVNCLNLPCLRSHRQHYYQPFAFSSCSLARQPAFYPHRLVPSPQAPHGRPKLLCSAPVEASASRSPCSSKLTLSCPLSVSTISVVHLALLQMSATLIPTARYVVLRFLPRHRYQHRLAPTCQVKGYTADQLDEALDGAKVIVIPAGVPRKV
jgi:hypothetical protein